LKLISTFNDSENYCKKVPDENENSEEDDTPDEDLSISSVFNALKIVLNFMT